jgi:hypothetical protein
VRFTRGRGCCEICAKVEERYWMMDVIRVTGTGRDPIALCAKHAHAVADDVRFERSLTGLKNALCGCCVQRAACVEIKRTDGKVQTLCAAKCARALDENLERLASDRTIEAVEFDPTWAPPSWWQFSEKAAAERQRRTR